MNVPVNSFYRKYSHFSAVKISALHRSLYRSSNRGYEFWHSSTNINLWQLSLNSYLSRQKATLATNKYILKMMPHYLNTKLAPTFTFYYNIGPKSFLFAFLGLQGPVKISWFYSDPIRSGRNFLFLTRTL